MIATHHEDAPDRLAVDQPQRVRRAQRIAAVISLIVIAVLLALDIAHHAPAAAPVQATIDAAASAGAAAKRDDGQDRWAADESALGTRPDATH